jgi:beta-galactosidase
MNRTDSRRGFLQSCLSAGAGLALAPLAAGKTGPAMRSLPLNQDWQFEKSVVTLPHCVVPLSWHNWNPSAWEKIWTYSRNFRLPREFYDARIFLHFEGALTSATPTLNGHALPRHTGGYLSFQYEITDFVKDGDNKLAVAVDARWQSVPPEGSPKGPSSIDYLEPGGMWGSVSLRAVPNAFIKDVVAKAVHVLDVNRGLDVLCTLDATHIPSGPIRLEARLVDRGNTVSRASKTVRFENPGETSTILHLENLGNVTLWDIQQPYLYEVLVTAFSGVQPVHEYRVRTGLREARFELDGFFLNGKRVQLFGLNRHELFPYVGRAMPSRVQRRDAEIISPRLPLQHGALLALPAIGVLSRRLRRARPDGLGRAARLAISRRRSLEGSVGARRARHGAPRPQPSRYRHLGRSCE